MLLKKKKTHGENGVKFLSVADSLFSIFCLVREHITKSSEQKTLFLFLLLSMQLTKKYLPNDKEKFETFFPKQQVEDICFFETNSMVVRGLRNQVIKEIQ